MSRQNVWTNRLAHAIRNDRLSLQRLVLESLLGAVGDLVGLELILASKRVSVLRETFCFPGRYAKSGAAAIGLISLGRMFAT